MLTQHSHSVYFAARVPAVVKQVFGLDAVDQRLQQDLARLQYTLTMSGFMTLNTTISLLACYGIGMKLSWVNGLTALILTLVFVGILGQLGGLTSRCVDLPLAHNRLAH